MDQTENETLLESARTGTGLPTGSAIGVHKAVTKMAATGLR